LASAVKGTVKIAYWDTEQRSRRPPLLGEIKGTPTIRLYKPKTKQGLQNSKKVVVDYNFERKAVDMKRFVDEQMPNFVEKIVTGLGDFSAFQDKASRNGLPQAILFTSKATTSPLTKYLSVEFRRRMLVAEISPTKMNKDVIEKLGIKDFPALVIIPVSSDTPADHIHYSSESFSRIKLHSFFSKHARTDKVVPKKKEKVHKENGEPPLEKEPPPVKKETVHTEL